MGGGDRDAGGERPSAGAKPKAQPAAKPGGKFDDFEDDIPF
jgi:hypothetical protein